MVITDLIPPIALRVWHRMRGLGWYNFEGSWNTLADVPVTPRTGDPWAATLPKTTRILRHDVSPAILPLLASQMVGPFTVLDFGGGVGIGLASILESARNVNPSNLTYILVETPAVARAVRAGIEAKGGRSLDEIPTSLPHPLIVNAESVLYAIPDYQSVLDRLIALKPDFLLVTNTPFSDLPTYARRSHNLPHITLGHLVFNRGDFVAGIERRGYRLIFSAYHDPKFTHKNAPEPSVAGSLVFSLKAA
jgi:putative methyltransferase (TIGR04325 family)